MSQKLVYSTVTTSNPMGTWFRTLPRQETEKMLLDAVQHAAQGLSSMVGQTIHVEGVQVKTMPLAQVSVYAGNPETEMVGIYLLIRGGLEGQSILLLSRPSAVRLVDLLLGASPEATPFSSEVGGHPMGDEPGQQPEIDWPGELERSVLAEIGNLMVSYFLNAVADSLGKERLLYPSPAAVMVDMLGALLDVIATPVAARSNELLVVSCDLRSENVFSQDTDGNGDSRTGVQMLFWILPQPTIRTTAII